MTTSIITDLTQIYKRDLLKLKNEIRQYTKESLLWEIDKSIPNSAGNLCLHLTGNLKTYIGNGLARTIYVRDRTYEFSAKNVSISLLLTQIDETLTIVEKGFTNLKEQDLQKEFPVMIWEEKKGMLFTLLHLHSHLNYHLGQINYHRRFFDA